MVLIVSGLSLGCLLSELARGFVACRCLDNVQYTLKVLECEYVGGVGLLDISCGSVAVLG